MFKNVKLYSIFAIMLVGLGAIGFVTMIDKTGYVSAIQKKWNVSLNEENYGVDGNAIELSTPSISKKEIDFNVQFSYPGEYKTYTFEVENLGNVDAHFVSASLSGNTDNVTFTYNISKGDKIIYNSVSETLDKESNHLYRSSKNLVEVVIKAGEDIKPLTSAVYTLKLNYEED